MDLNSLSTYGKSTASVTVSYGSDATICSVDISQFEEGSVIALIGYYRENGDSTSVTINWNLYDVTNSNVIFTGYEAGNTWGGSRSVNAVITKTNQTVIRLRASKQTNTGTRTAQAGSTIIAIRIG